MEFTVASKSELIEGYIVRELLPRLQAGEKLPSELELSKQLGTSRPTIHKIFSNLTSLGLLERRNGIGTFVSGKPKIKNDTVMAVLASPYEMSPTQSPSWFSSQYILEGFGTKASQAGIGVQIVHLHPDERSYAETVDILLKSKAGAYLFTELGGYGEIVKELVARGSICVVRSPWPSEIAHSVCGLLKEGVKEGVKALIDSGCKRIAHFSISQQPDITHRYEVIRYSGYEEALKEAGIPIDRSLLRECGGFPHDGYMETRKMLAEGVRPDAVFGGADFRALGIIQALKEAGLRIPQDVSVLGSDNLPDCLKQDPPLSTVEYPMRRMGEAMFEILQEAAANPGCGPISKALNCEFIRRGSMRGV